MKIKSIETEVKSIPLKTPFVTALRRVEAVEFVRVKVVCQNKSFAYGEAPATKAITNEGIEDILTSMESIKELLQGKHPQEALQLLHEQQKIGSSAKAALDMAFVSLLAQEFGEPLYKFLGGKAPIELQTDITISLGTLDTMLRDAKGAYESGLNILKIKVGSDIKHAIAVILELAFELPKVKILVDANQAWSLEESLFFINAVQGVKIELIEQPVIAHDLASLKKITRESATAILADEAVFTLEDVARVHEGRYADMINIKLMKCGGISKAVEILEYARAHGIRCMLGSMLEGPLSINAALHLAIAFHDVIAYIDLDSPLLYKESSKELEFLYVGSKIVFIEKKKAKI
ncbi:MAG TPA: dipeptide epimerase [Sulfurimonas sp. UBA12504]|nr:MAG: dipeptide epimerase [Sulfurimonas sp. GWF2_37_8]DAB29601.1 MAG TPA: dipeptide epimerase [Sulfurimonas sp. UBA12504]